jgi:hypothetical protein
MTGEIEATAAADRLVRVPTELLERARALAPALRADAKVRAAGGRLSTAAAVRLLLLRGVELAEADARRKVRP